MPAYYYDDAQLFVKTVKSFINKNKKIHQIQPIYVRFQEEFDQDNKSKIVFKDKSMKNFSEQFDLLKVIGNGATSKIMLGRKKNN